MPALAAATTWHERLKIATSHPTQFIDLTADLASIVARSGIRTGFVNVQSLHTTTAVILNEHEPLLLEDFTMLLGRMAPGHYRYRHDEPGLRTVNLTADERVNGHSHCRAVLLSPSIALNLVDGKLQLGKWQRVFLVELDGPQERSVSILVLGETC